MSFLNIRGGRIGTARANLTTFVRSRYPMAEVTCGQGMFNHRCHENAVHWAYRRESRGAEVHEVIYVDGGQPILHYINRIDGTFIDNTLGFFAKRHEYYIIRKIAKSDWAHILSEFNMAREGWLNQFTTMFDRKLLRIDNIV